MKLQKSTKCFTILVKDIGGDFLFGVNVMAEMAHENLKFYLSENNTWMR